MLYENKSIGVYDLLKKKKIFQSEPNHSETIFDAKFHPLNPMCLATSSFDGKIKIWNIKHYNCIQTLELEKRKNDGKSKNYIVIK